MELLTYDDAVDIDVHELIMDIDDIMHRRITNGTGIIIPHNDIQKFVADLIRENNKMQHKLRNEQNKLRNEQNELEDEIKEFNRDFDKMYKKKINQGKVIENRNGISNKIKYYIFNYVLIRHIGCGSTTRKVRCEDCIYDYNSEGCKTVRKEYGYLLLYDNKKFI